MYPGQFRIGLGMAVAAAALLVDAAFFPEQFFEPALAGQEGFALLGGELDIVVAVAVVEQVGHFAAVLADQAADETADALAQVVVGDPVLMAGLQAFLLVVEVAQHAQVVVEGGEHRMQRAGIAMCLGEPGIGSGYVPGDRAPLSRPLLRHFGMARGGLLALGLPGTGVHVGLCVFGAGRLPHPLAEGVHVFAVGGAVARMVVGQGFFAHFGHQFRQQSFGAVEGWAVGRREGAGHLRKGDMAHALAGIFRQMLAGRGGQGDFAVQQPGVVAFVQGDAGRLAVHGQGVVVIQGLFQQQASLATA